jgi:hypothetical protein
MPSINYIVVTVAMLLSSVRALGFNKSSMMKKSPHHLYHPGERGIASELIHSKYEKLQSTKIHEYGIEAVLYRHKKSGASVLSVIAPQDENKVFGITFRTPPSDSTGIPHILEHSVLCGSRRFPVKEPFVDLMRGSLQTFLNAFTYPDRTCYPVASMNTKDFYNLINVYLDAVLYPKCISDEMVLQQEGWHYELEKESDPLTFKGVVYNEMKGVYSSPDSLMGTATQMALFPDNTYGTLLSRLSYQHTHWALAVAPSPCVQSLLTFVCMHQLRRRLRRQPQGHPEPDLQAVQGLPRRLLPPIE